VLCQKIRVFRLVAALKHGPELAIVHSIGKPTSPNMDNVEIEVLFYHASNVVLEREFGVVRLEAGCVRRGSSGTQAVKSRVRFTSDIATDRS
jgi:hypothetical protein